MTNQEISCIGCGVTIQTDNPDEIGYAPLSALRKKKSFAKDAFD